MSAPSRSHRLRSRRRVPVARPLSAALLTAAALAAASVPAGATAGPASPAGALGSLTGSLDDPGAGSQTPPGAQNLPAGFDLQSHRGGRGETTEESLRAFAKSLDLGVTTLELDIGITADGIPVVWHDPVISAEKCVDTSPATPGDPQFPYVGAPVHDLTWAQIQTLDCGLPLSAYPEAEVVAGNRIAQLSEVFALTAERGADVHFNIETKLDPTAPEETATGAEFVDAILAEVRAAGVRDKVMIQSFDWSTLPLVAAQEPQIPLVMLWTAANWVPGSPWTGPVDFLSVGGDITAAADRLGAAVLSPHHSLVDSDLLAAAEAAGLRVVPWTVNDRSDMATLIDLGVDGISTDHPTRLRELMIERGMDVPTPYPAS